MLKLAVRRHLAYFNTPPSSLSHTKLASSSLLEADVTRALPLPPSQTTHYPHIGSTLVVAAWRARQRFLGSRQHVDELHRSYQDTASDQCGGFAAVRRVVLE